MSPTGQNWTEQTLISTTFVPLHFLLPTFFLVCPVIIYWDQQKRMATLCRHSTVASVTFFFFFLQFLFRTFGFHLLSYVFSAFTDSSKVIKFIKPSEAQMAFWKLIYYIIISRISLYFKIIIIRLISLILMNIIRRC